MSVTMQGSNALTAKIRAMYGRRLNAQNYKELLRKQTVNEVASYLKQQTSYSGPLKEINENLVHRGQLEVVLRRQLFEEYTKMFHYIDSDSLHFYDFLILKMEIDEILSCLRFLNAGKQGEYIFSLPAFFAKHSSVDLYALAKVKSYEDLMSLLRGTRYYDILAKFDQNDNKKLDLTKIEFEFKKYYYISMIKVINAKFSDKERDDIRDSFGMEIDLGNITSIIRLKKYFNADSSYIRSTIFPYYFKLNKAAIDRIIDAPDIESAISAAKDTYYGRYFIDGNYNYIEKYAKEIMYRYHRHLMMFTTSSSVAVIAYLQLKQNEISNIISIIEGIRYELEPAEISKLLTGADN